MVDQHDAGEGPLARGLGDIGRDRRALVAVDLDLLHGHATVCHFVTPQSTGNFNFHPSRRAPSSSCRARISRPPRQPREQSRRYEWRCPGDLLHIDSKRFVRFNRPGHAVIGDRHVTGAEKRMRVGYESVHSLVDDRSRLAYSEILADEQGSSCAAFLRRAGVPPLRWTVSD